MDADSSAGSSGSTENRARYNYSVYLNLTYGAKGIFWFTASTMFDKTTGTISKQGYYNDVQQMNAKLINLGPHLINLTSTAIYHTGIGTCQYDFTDPTGSVLDMEPIPANHWVKITENGFALGMFTNENGDNYAMVMNRNRTTSKTATVTFPIDAISDVQVFNASSGTWTSAVISGLYPNQSITISCDKAEGKLIKIIK